MKSTFIIVIILCILLDLKRTRADQGKNKSSTPLVCRKRRLNGVILRMRPQKNKALRHIKYGTIKFPFLLKGPMHRAYA
jgi:hypothetical protein